MGNLPSGGICINIVLLTNDCQIFNSQFPIFNQFSITKFSNKDKLRVKKNLRSLRQEAQELNLIF